MQVSKQESRNDFYPYFVNMDIDSLLPKEKRTSFQKSFAYLRKKLQIKLMTLTRNFMQSTALKKLKKKIKKLMII